MPTIDYGQGPVNVDVKPLTDGRDSGSGFALPVTTPPPEIPTTPTSPAPTPTTNPVTPFDRGPGNYGDLPGATDAPTKPQDLSTLVEQQRQNAQAEIDSISAGYDKNIESERQAGIVREARTRAINQSSGLGGSDFASAAAADTEKGNQKIVASLQAEKAAKIAMVLSKADDRALQLQQQQTANYRQDSEKALTARKAVADSAKDDIKTLGGQGVTADKLKTSDPKLYQDLLHQTGFTPIELDSYLLAAHPGIDMKNVKTTKIGDNLVMSYLDPTTKQIVHSTYAVPGSSAYDGFTVAPDGTALFYNKNTGETKIAGTEGQYAKDPNAGKTINPGKYGTLVYDAATKSWKPIRTAGTTNPGGGSSSPATGLYTKQTYSRLKAAGVDQSMADKLGSAILKGIPLDQIRAALTTDKVNPKILDYYDNVVNISSLLKNHPANKSSASIPGVTP